MNAEICVTDWHHGVLDFWAAWQREHRQEVTVLTLDHHTDVVRAYRDENREVPAGAWQEETLVREAIAGLRHDEHFDWAVRSGLINRAFIASHTCATLPANNKLHICCDPLWPDENALFCEPEKYRPLADSVLESSYLFRQFGEISQYGRFILDIDCDYILTAKALEPEDSGYLEELLSCAQLITFSLESDWVRLLRFRGETITSGEIVEKISRFRK